MSDMRVTFDKYDELLPLKKLKRSKHQRNKHPQDQIQRLAKIMEAHGVRHPIHISKLSGQVCFGHGRWEAAKLNKYESFPVIYQDFKDDDEEYSCVQSDNAIAHWAELDLGAINMDIGNLGPDFDIDLLGIKDLVIEPADKFEAQCDEDAVPEHVEPNAKLGDVYQLGRHRLMCGDSTSITDVEKLMAGDKADMVFTDPPYGMNVDTNYKDENRKSSGIYNGKDMERAKSVSHRRVIGDGSDFKPDLINGVFAAFNYVDEIFLFGADYYAELLPNRNDGSWVVWDKVTKKDGEVSGISKFHGSNFELCWSRKKHKRDLARIMHKGLGSVENDKRVHATQKPVALPTWFFEQWGEGRTNVADLFGGSGSTLIACEKTNRRCFMMELDPHYIDVIIARWEKYTGQKAELLNGEGKEPIKVQSRKAKDRTGPRADKKARGNRLLNGRNRPHSRL